MAKVVNNKWLKEANKLMEKEKKNPGKENKEKFKEINKNRRGEPIPKPKIVQTEEEKQRDNRSRRKDKYRSEISRYLDR